MTEAIKLCECGCGQPTVLARRTDKKRGDIKGVGVRFIRGHAQRGRATTPETRKKLSEGWTPEMREAAAERGRLRTAANSEFYKQGLAKGREALEQMGMRSKEYLADLARKLPRDTPGQRERTRKMNFARRGKPRDIEITFSKQAIENIREGIKHRVLSDEGRRQLSLNAQRQMASRGPTCLEVALYARLLAEGLEFEREKPIGCYHVDAYVASTRTVYEADGPYHLRPKQKASDQRRDAYLLRNPMVDRIVRLTPDDLLAKKATVDSVTFSSSEGEKTVVALG
jgi:very-short-patch-repair endonuclease